MMEDLIIVHRKCTSSSWGQESTSCPFSQAHDPGQTGIEPAVWKTCLRQMLFCNPATLGSLKKHLSADDEILHNDEALSLLLEILCGLHSPVVGETEVYGQFKLFTTQRQTGNDPLFGSNQKWLNFITKEVKRVRSSNLIGLGSQSYGSLLRRHTKNHKSATICGSGQLALEILPWMNQKESLQVICRNPAKLHITNKEKFQKVEVLTYQERPQPTEVLIVAAPLPDAEILKLTEQLSNPTLCIFDLRGEANQLPLVMKAAFPKAAVIDLRQFFADIERTKEAAELTIYRLKKELAEKADNFFNRTQLRPLGWEDLCY